MQRRRSSSERVVSERHRLTHRCCHANAPISYLALAFTLAPEVRSSSATSVPLLWHTAMCKGVSLGLYSSEDFSIQLTEAPRWIKDLTRVLSPALTLLSRRSSTVNGSRSTWSHRPERSSQESVLRVCSELFRAAAPSTHHMN